jgi:hypothetical protein
MGEAPIDRLKIPEKILLIIMMTISLMLGVLLPQ